jgi:transcriptional regulator with XRE-family HTH domain
MVIGDKLKELRETKKLSQGDIEKRTGLLCCYISRVENGHTVPNADTLEKMARALEVPLYRLFTDDAQVKKPDIPIPNGEPAHNSKAGRPTSPICESIVAPGRQRPKAPVPHGFENGESRVVVGRNTGRTWPLRIKYQ